MKRSPMPRKRAKPRRRPANVCTKQRCISRAWLDGLCRSHATTAADEVFGATIRAAGRCRALDGWHGSMFDCSGSFQCCHLVSRMYRNVRWDEDNAVCMCAAHHKYFDDHPIEREQTILMWFGPSHWHDLKVRALATNVDWRDRLAAVLGGER